MPRSSAADRKHQEVVTPQSEKDRAWRYARAMAEADDEDLMEWEREYGRRARAAMRIADAEISAALADRTK